MSVPAISHEIRAAAMLADPGCAGASVAELDLPLEGINWERVLRVLVRNKVPLLCFGDNPEFDNWPLLQRCDFQARLQAERSTWQGLRDEYALVERAFLRRGFRGMAIKSVGLAPSFPYTSDNLDILVGPEHIEPAREALNDLGYVELPNVEEPLKFLFRKFRGSESVSAIHLHGQVGWGVPFLDERALWDRACQSPDDPLVLVPGPEDGLLITVAHALYENKSFKLLDLARIRHSFRRCERQPLDLRYIGRVACDRGWGDGLALSLLLCASLEERLYGASLIPEELRRWAWREVSGKRWLRRQLGVTLERPLTTFPYRVSFAFAKLLYYRKLLSDRGRSPVTRLADVIATLAWAARLKLHVTAQKGMLVSFSGIDGSGKTLHARTLIQVFPLAELHARYLWSRTGSAAWMKPFARLARRARGVSPSESGAGTASALAVRRRRLGSPALRLAWALVTVCDLVVRYNLKARLPRLFRGIVVCDRYIYDAMVEMTASLPDIRVARWAERCLRALCPRPDLAWLLDVAGLAAARRQADEGEVSGAAAELERQRELYLELAGRYGLKVVGTLSDPQASSSRVVRDTLEHYYRDYGTVVGAIFLSNPDQMNGQCFTEKESYVPLVRACGAHKRNKSINL